MYGDVVRLVLLEEEGCVLERWYTHLTTGVVAEAVLLGRDTILTRIELMVAVRIVEEGDDVLPLGELDHRVLDETIDGHRGIGKGLSWVALLLVIDGDEDVALGLRHPVYL